MAQAISRTRGCGQVMAQAITLIQPRQILMAQDIRALGRISNLEMRPNAVRISDGSSHFSVRFFLTTRKNLTDLGRS